MVRADNKKRKKTDNNNFTRLLLIRPKTTNIGNAANIYLGMLENVPVRVGVTSANQEKIRYDNLTFLI